MSKIIEVIGSMKSGGVLYSSHPYKGGKKFVARIENDGESTAITKKQFMSLLDNKLIEKSDRGTNRQYVYISKTN